ncbi:MAG: peptide-methionine (S)-S-oxide reductase [Bacteroidetes bacterium]|nr:MAG: peptide-methionine (S)-S-oxide reductase [Bacteroidota bacterium]
MKKIILSILLSGFIMTAMAQNNIDTATFGSGCFWCSEAIFERLQGVNEVTPGYAGGTKKNPSYNLVCSGTTNYAEVIQLTYNPEIISYNELLEVFWKTHDPTTLNRQGADVGTQYRSVIFYHNQQQKETAEYYKTELYKAKIWNKPIVTQIEPVTNFYPAEKYHNDYYKNNPGNGYCNFVITPKIEKFEKLFKEKLK